MCGICGIIGFDGRKQIEEMNYVVSHRGPDDEGVISLEENQVHLGSRRLSILDLSSRGHMPMTDEEKSCWITYNGEVYNYRELREELRQKGYRFQSNTDTEVILNGYLAWGIEILNKLNGMFAFAIWDQRKKQLFAARDRLGIKPFYYYQKNHQFVFASEIKSILASQIVSPDLNWDAFNSYLTFLWVPAPLTVFKNIFKLHPGHYLIYREGQLSIQEYWDIKFEEDHSKNEKYWIREIQEKLENATKLQMISDVPLGLFFSGGIDSSSILFSMNRNSDKPITTFTAGFSTKDFEYEIVPDDIKYSRLLSKRMKIDYNEIELHADVVNLLPKIIWHLDEPIADPAVITTYLISQSAKKKLTVLLSGIGGDELFAGYPRHLAEKIARLYILIPKRLRETFIKKFVQILPGAKQGLFHTFFRNLKKFEKNANMDFVERYLGYGTYFTNEEKSRILSPDFKQIPQEYDAYRYHEKYFENVKNQHFVNQMLYLDIKTFLPALNLTYTDKSSMAASVEVRVPFLENGLVELSAKIPVEYKLNGFTRKYILKKVMEKHLPKEIIWRKKAGFGAPIRSWLVNELKEMTGDLLSEAVIKRRGYFDYSEVKKIMDEHRRGFEDNSLKIWQLLTFELWHQIFIDNGKARLKIN